VPVHPVHPDPEQLAAWQAGELGGRDAARIEAHVAGCTHCAGTVATVQRGRSALAGLGEPDLPAGLHERLAVAIERERLASAEATGNGTRDPERHGAGVAEPIPLDVRRDRRRPGAGGRRPARRRVALLSTAAAVILVVAGLFPLVRSMTAGSNATQTASRPATASGTPAPTEGLATGTVPVPVFSAPEGYSGAALRSALESVPNARAAYQRAANAPVTQRSGAGGGGGSGQPPAAAPFEGSKESSGGAADSGGTAQGGLQQAACLAAARTQAGDQSLRPAFFVTTVYQGRKATVLVTAREGAADQADLWAFPRGDCSVPPFAHEQVTVQTP
jgi:hypothetical protein